MLRNTGVIFLFSRFVYIVEVVGRGRESVSYSSHPVSLQVGPATIREDQLCLVLSGNKTEPEYNKLKQQIIKTNKTNKPIIPNV